MNGIRRDAAVIVFEPDGGGHRYWFCAGILQAATEAGLPIRLASRARSFRSVEASTHLADWAIERISLRGPVKTYRLWAGLYYASILRYLSTRSRVIIPDGDNCVLPWLLTGFMGGGRAVFLILRTPEGGFKGRVKSWAIDRLTRAGNEVLFLGDPWGELASPWMLPSRARIVADPVEVGEWPSDSSGIVTCRKVLLVAGRIDLRKRVDLALAVLDHLPDVTVHIAGRVADEAYPFVRGAQDRHPARVTVDDAYLSDSALNSAVWKSSVVWCVLSTDQGSSGLLGKAAGCGVPVVAGGNRTVTSAVQRHRLGEVIEKREPRPAAEAVRRVLDGNGSSEPRRLSSLADFGRSMLGLS